VLAFLVTAICAFLLYLLFTTASGPLLLWSKYELIIGVVFAVIVGIVTKDLFIKRGLMMLHPRRCFLFLIYLIGPFFFAMARANIDVVYRVITGRINPGIVKISPNLKNDLSLTLLANSITLTPGTLTVEVDEKKNDLYIHWINVDRAALEKMPRDCACVCGPFPDWARRIAE